MARKEETIESIDARLEEIRQKKIKLRQELRDIKNKQRRIAHREELLAARQIGQVILSAVKRQDSRIDKSALSEILDEKIESKKARHYLQDLDLVSGDS